MPTRREQMEYLFRAYAKGGAEGSFKSSRPTDVDMDNALGRDFFAKPSIEVAKGLLGRPIVRRYRGKEITGMILGVSAWTGEVRSSSDGMLYAPGTIGISTKFGNRILDIATDLGGKASCVTLERIMLNGAHPEKVDGRGSVAKALKLDKEFDKLKIYDNGELYIVGGHMPEFDFDLRRKKKMPANYRGHFYLKQ